MRSPCFISLLVCLTYTCTIYANPDMGYYRHPAIHEETVVFVSEGDLWKVPLQGGTAVRLTTHPGEETLPAISPDGRNIAFCGHYEGPAEIYTMPITGGQPKRWTFDAGRITYVGWANADELMFATNAFATLPNQQLVRINVNSGLRARVPLFQADDGDFLSNSKTLIFTRLPFQGSHTKRYKGGTAQSLWKFTPGKEAIPLTRDYPGTSRRPLVWKNRIYFVSDRDGFMNIWSMNPDGGVLKQHTKHKNFDVAKPSLHDGRIVYQLGADLHWLDIASGATKKIPITLSSDFDQLREKWIEKPMEYLTASHLSPDGKRVVLTARGQIFTAPVKQGRFVTVTRKPSVRLRYARFLNDDTLIAMSDETGEVELWALPADGVGTPEQLTKDGEVLRWQGVPSPDAKWIAHTDKNQRLFIYHRPSKKNLQIDISKIDAFEDLAWSPDSQWLAYMFYDDNLFRRIKLYNVESKQHLLLTSDRYDSYSPAWSPDGKWIYFLSDRRLKSVVRSPWGNYQPEPFLDKKTKIYHIALTAGLRSPFAERTELDSEKTKTMKDQKEPAVKVTIEVEGLQRRLYETPVDAGNYRNLAACGEALFWQSQDAGDSNWTLQSIAVSRDDPKVETVAKEIQSYEMSGDGKSLLIRKKDSLHVVDAAPKSADLAKGKISLSDWKLSVIPRNEWRQMFVESWRLERDYFYDRGLHGIDWNAMKDKYLPLVDRVRSREELADLMAQMVSELSALHIFVRPGDVRESPDDIMPASLGAVLTRDTKAGGYRVDHIYQSDPDEPNLTAPLARPNVNVKEGDIITQVNGVEVLSVPDIGKLLRNQAGDQVLLHVKSKDNTRKVIVKPISMSAAENLRYHEWEYTRRLEVDKKSKGDIGYVHLRAMGGGNFTEWAKNFYPVFTRQGLIIDVRHNRGGNIDSWILGRLLRKAWFYWNQRIGKAPMWNMQYAFRGHVVVLCNERTASDGEAFTEGVKRLKLGNVIGTRTWGGEIWLSANNFLVDKGIATAAEYGVYGPEGVWLIEGHGVEPDIVVDNLPHATFKGRDAQLEAAIRYLQKKIKEDPVPPAKVPEFPNKRFRPQGKQEAKKTTNAACGLATANGKKPFVTERPISHVITDALLVGPEHACRITFGACRITFGERDLL